MEKKTAAVKKTALPVQGKYYKEQFEKISDEKRKRIIEAALMEFSSMGYNAANINVIAKNAGISIGSMYQYFESKENLFLTIIDEAYNVIENSISHIDALKGDLFYKFDIIISYIQKYAREYRLLNQLYLEATTQGVSRISKKLSLKMETISSEYYRSLIIESIKNGIADKKLDPEVTAFCVDNIFLLLQFSYSSEYYSERMKIFTGENALKEDKRIRKEIMYILKKILV